MEDLDPVSDIARPEPAVQLRDDLVKLFRVGALYAVAVACSLGTVEFLVFGFEYWGALLTSVGTALAALAFFVLTGRGRSIAGGWALFVGCWLMIMADAAFQEGAMTHSVLAMPLLILVAVWMTGSVTVTYLLAGATTVTLLLIELAFFFNVIQPQGISNPLVGIITVAGAMFLTAYVLLAIYKTNIARLQAEHELAESLAERDHENRLIIENSVDPYYRADLDGRIVNISPSIERMTGYSPDELIGKRLADFYVDPSQREVFLQQLQENGGEVQNFEAAITAKDGNPVVVSTSAHFWRGRDGSVLGVEGTVRDVTELHELQEKINRAGRIETLDQLSGGLAHNFNNLLAIVQGHAELLELCADDPEEIRRVAGLISQAADRGVDLTRRMMAFSSHAVSEDVESIHVNELIQDIKPIMETSLTRDVDVHLELADELWLAQSHAGEFEDAIINLALNARDAMASSGTLTIKTFNANLGGEHQPTNPDFVRGECVAVAVIDNGEGIPAELVPKLIEPFFTTKSKDSGTGLGLSMVYGFLRRTGGDIQIQSRPGQGTTVTLYLPRGEEKSSGAEHEPESVLAAARAPSRVLVVEDEAPLRDLNERRLQLMGYSTFAVESGVRAKEILESDEPVDIVFSDIMMPGGVSGYDLVDIVRELRPGTPIVLCTGYAAERTGSLQRDTFKILRKPFTNDDLAEAIREELEAVSAA